MKIYMKGKQITKEEAEKLLGDARWLKRLQNADESHMEDPNQEISWMDGMEIRY